MQAAIIGLPRSGKTTLFTAVTGAAVDAYAPPEPKRAIVSVPDRRLAYLAHLCKPKKVTEATIEFVDIPGCALHDPKGQEEWRRRMPVVQQAQVLVVVIRDFENPAVPPHRNRVDYAAEFREVWDELIFADLETVTTRVERIEQSLRKPTKTHDAEERELALLTRCREALESGAPLSTVIATDEHRRQVSHFAFLTGKPLVAVRNVSEDRVTTVTAWEVPHVEHTMVLSASIEAEMAMLNEADRQAFLAEWGLAQPARDRLIHTCYRACGLISFMTMGSEEARAWAIPEGTTALEAAAKVHTDFARGFIRAETVAFDDLVAHKDLKGAKAAGRVRKEGKTYIVQDGDVLHILASPAQRS